MSVSPTCNLLCDESTDDIVSMDADICSDYHESFDHSLIDDEEFIVNIFNLEVDHQKQGSELLAKYRNLPELVTSRQEAIKWILKVYSHSQFRPETAYLSVNYLDRFLLSHSMKPGKGWQWHLLSVACLAVAAKMEETSVPNLLDLQLIEPSSRFLFKPKTVHRMELLVMSSLKWRLCTVTPFDFVHYFISKISCFNPQRDGFGSVFSHAAALIISTRTVIDFLACPPSTIAAAVVLWATDHSVDEQNLGCFHKRLNKDMVRRCYNLIRKNRSQLLHINSVQKPEHVAVNDKLRVVFGGSCDD